MSVSSMMKFPSTSISAISAALLLLSAQHTIAGPIVTVLNGTYEGFHLSTYQQDVFLGMPYAQPPVRDLRFRGPQSLNTSWDGVRSAVEYSDVCMQYVSLPGYPMSEDCLSINVIKPTNYNGTEKLPVAVWIYGGGLYSGSSRDHNLTNFVVQAAAANKPLISVSLNYRLSAFGFLWGSDELKANGSANNGLRDQRLALHWIQENIGFFGGDKSRVTIFGQSAGGLSVGKHLIAYGGRDDGLFHGAILQSGGMVEKWPYNIRDPEPYTEDLYQNLTTTTGCINVSSPLECLRALPVESLSTALNYTDTPVLSGTGLGPWLLQVDGDIIQDGPTESLDKGHFVDVPIMYTSTTDEATVFMYENYIDTDEDFATFVAVGGPDSETVSFIETLYPNVNALTVPAAWVPTAEDIATYGRQWKRAITFQTDVVETASRRKTVETWAAAGGTVYSGRINLLPPSTTAMEGSHHAIELTYIFNNLAVVDANNTALVRMSEFMSRTWASFVSDLDPNHHGFCGVPIWPAWNSTNVDGIGSNFVFNADGNKIMKSYIELDDYRLAQTRYLSSVMETQMYY